MMYVNVRDYVGPQVIKAPHGVLSKASSLPSGRHVHRHHQAVTSSPPDKPMLPNHQHFLQTVGPRSKINIQKNLDPTHLSFWEIADTAILVECTKKDMSFKKDPDDVKYPQIQYGLSEHRISTGFCITLSYAVYSGV